MKNAVLAIKTKDAIQMHDMHRYWGKNYAIRFVRLLPVVAEAYAVVGGPLPKKPGYVKKGDTLGMIDNADISKVYLLMRKLPVKEAEKIVSGINSTREFRKRLLAAQD